MKSPVSDFSAPEYWSARFAKERSFEWLATSTALGPVVLRLVKELIASRSADGSPGSGPVNILHFGCGKSSLGPDLAALHAEEGVDTRVVDADYVSDSILTDRRATSRDGAGEGGRTEVPLINLNVLDPTQLCSTAPDGGWDLLLDKSTADAISCGPSLPWPGESEGSEEVFEPIYVLCDNLARVTRVGGRWLCVSYSATRFDHLRSSPGEVEGEGKEEDSEGGGSVARWRLVSATSLDGAFTGEPSTADGRVVYAPQTNVWAYVLERI